MSETDPELGIKVESIKQEEYMVQTDEWYYLACNRTTGQEWFMTQHKTAVEASHNLAHYRNYPEAYEIKIIRIKLPI